MNDKISDKDKKAWKDFLSSNEKLPNKDNKLNLSPNVKIKHIDLHGFTLQEANKTVENIGARRLHTIIEKILDDISFTATDRSGEKIVINKEYINKNLDNLVKDTDLSKFIL